MVKLAHCLRRADVVVVEEKLMKRHPHPGEIIRDEYMRLHDLTLEDLATLTEIALDRLIALIAGRRRIVSDTARSLASLFNTTPEYWLQLQRDYEDNRPAPRRIIVVASSSARTRERQDPELRNAALKLVDDGLSSEQAGDRVGGIKKMTVAGWRSARTKGCYDDEGGDK